MDKSKSHSDAAERFQAAREERDRRAAQYEAASGSPGELPAFAELQALSRNSPRGRRGSGGPRGTTRS
jgi:hypothetical protein